MCTAEFLRIKTFMIGKQKSLLKNYQIIPGTGWLNVLAKHVISLKLMFSDWTLLTLNHFLLSDFPKNKLHYLGYEQAKYQWSSGCSFPVSLQLLL